MGVEPLRPTKPVLSDRVQLWDLDRSPRPQTAAVEGSVNDVALSPDGRWIAFAGRGLVWRRGRARGAGSGAAARTCSVQRYGIRSR